MAFDPISAVSGLSPLQKSGLASDIEYFWNSKQAAEFGFQDFEADFDELSKSFGGNEVENSTTSRSRIQSTKILKWTAGYKQYASEDDGWYLAGRLVGRRVQIKATVDASRGKMDARALGPELAGGYRWTFRHGSFCSLGVGLTYWRTTSSNTTWSVPISIANPDSLDNQIMSVMRSRAYEISPIGILRLGYLFH